MNRFRQSGFTMIELMIVLVILGLIITIGYPAYTDQMRKSRRTEALSKLQDHALLQEQYRANNASYATMAELTAAFGVLATDDNYTYTVTGQGASAYTLTATAKSPGAQASDTGCTTLNLDESNVKTPTACW